MEGMRKTTVIMYRPGSDERNGGMLMFTFPTNLLRAKTIRDNEMAVLAEVL